MKQRICDMCGAKILSGMYNSWQLIEDANPMSFTKNKHITDLCERCGKEIKNIVKKKKERVS